MLLRFSSSSMLLAMLVAAMLLALNAHQTRTVSEPYYAPLLGAVWHPPPYDIKEMAIDVHYDRGWPIWHTRRSESFAAHNAPLYLREDRPLVAQSPGADFGVLFDDDVVVSLAEPAPTDWVRAGADTIVGFSIVAMSLMLFEFASRRIRTTRERPVIIDAPRTTT